MSKNDTKRGLLQRLAEGPVVIAEGYVFELERRGYVKAGAYVPEVVLEHPEVVRQLHHEFVRAGSDVTLALTYYAHREKLQAIGRENDLESLNRTALTIAKEVAEETGTIFAGNICNTGAYDTNDIEASEREVRRQYAEQVGWAAEAGVDFILAETIEYAGEALIALEEIKKRGLTAVINFATILDKSKDGYEWVEAAKLVKDAGADIVGFNCSRGPRTILPLVKSLRKAVDGPIAAVPVPYRTDAKHPAFTTFRNSRDNESAYTVGLDEFLCTRDEMADFARDALDAGATLIGVCCGAGPHHIRAVAEALGRKTAASKYSPDMSQHYIFGSKNFAKKYEATFLKEITR